MCACLEIVGFSFGEEYAVIGSIGRVVRTEFYLSNLCLPVSASTTPDPVEARIFHAVLPMTSADAQILTDILFANRVDAEHRADLIDHLRTTVFGNSVPKVQKAVSPPLCAAVALRRDVDQVMSASPDGN